MLMESGSVVASCLRGRVGNRRNLITLVLIVYLKSIARYSTLVCQNHYSHSGYQHKGDKWLRRIKRTRRVHQGLQEEKRGEDRHVKGYKQKTRRNERKTRNEKKRNRKTRDKEESSTLHTTKTRLQ